MQTVFQILLRLEHLFEPLEHPELSSDLEVDLSSLFSAFEVRAVQEMALGANVPISQVGLGKMWKNRVPICCALLLLLLWLVCFFVVVSQKYFFGAL